MDRMSGNSLNLNWLNKGQDGGVEFLNFGRDANAARIFMTSGSVLGLSDMTLRRNIRL